MGRAKEQTKNETGEPYYPDKGCKKAKTLGYSGSCLSCPFSHCLEDKDVVKSKRAKRNDEIRQRYCAGASIEELDKQYKLHYESIRRLVSGR